MQRKLSVKSATRMQLSPDCKVELKDEERVRLKELFEEITDEYTFDTARVLSHEGWHQYFHNYTVSIVSMPSWLDEGVGDYFFTATRDGQNADGGHGYRLGDINMYRLRVLRRGLAEGSAVDFPTLLDFEQEQYYSNPSVFYAQGWSIVHMLRQGKGMQPKWQKILPEYLTNLLAAREEVATEVMNKTLADAEKVKKGSSDELPKEVKEYYGKVDEDKVQDRAFDKTFKDWTDADWEAFQKYWLGYVENL